MLGNKLLFRRDIRMLRRLPISLRFDDEDSDFYYGFIEIKKENRELSTLILNLLHVYYENELVRNAVDDYMIAKSPYMQIHEELQRIALEHNKQSVSTSMLGDYTKNEASKISEPSKQENKGSSNESENVLMLTQDQLKNEVQKAVQGAMSEIIKMMNSTKKDNEKVVEELQEKSVSEKSYSTEKKDYTTKQMDIPNKSFGPETLSVDDETQIAETLSNIPEIQVGAKKNDSTLKKPASFGKLLKSVK